MKYYDARIIEGCCVFSYAVECPSRPVEQSGKSENAAKKAEKKKRAARTSFRKKAIFSILFLLLAPLAFVADMICFGFKKISAICRMAVTGCTQNREIATCILTALSSSAVIPILLLIL